MDLFYHLVSGIILGFLFHSPAFVVGSLIPDVIDKTFGYMFVGSGREPLHSLIALLIFSGITAYAYVKKKRIATVLAFFAGGIAFHQFLDAMWTSPKVWLFPLLGNVARSPVDPVHQIEWKISVGATSHEEILLYLAVLAAAIVFTAWKIKKSYRISS